MRVQVIERFGGPEVFTAMEMPRPEVRPGHVVVRVMATSVNPVDCKNRASKRPTSPDLPAILHGDVAGVVEEVGEGVARFRPGDEVYGCAGGVRGLGGALAEFMPADADLLAAKPKSLDMAHAAALPLVSITAWEALIDRANIQPGQAVLVHGGAGGVGHIGVQLAKWRGARVFATVSGEEKARIARELGADVTINYRERPVADYVREHTGGRGFDIVFDTAGGANIDRSFEAVRLNGTVVSILTQSTHDLTPMHVKGLSLHVVLMLIPLLHNVGRAHHGEILTAVAELVDEGRLRPLLDPRRFTFDEVADAHRHLESGKAVGKVVIAR